MLLTLLAMAASAAPTAEVAVTYSLTFDLPPMADQVCSMTGICDCQVVWTGSGRMVSQSGDQTTFQGTYLKTSGGCHEALELWTPADGKAYHTITVRNGRLVRWVAHASPSLTAPLQTGAKAAGQVYLTEMSVAFDAQGVARHRESETGDAGGIALASAHELSIKVRPAPEAP